MPYYDASMGNYQPAAICRRGHVITADIDSESPSPKCGECGAGVLTACPNLDCGAIIRGLWLNDFIMPYSGPSNFCHECGVPYPWADRTARIYELENRLEEEELSPAESLALREDLEALIAADPDDEDEQRRLWKRIAERAPAVWEKSGARAITETLVSAAVRSSMGW